MNIKLSNNTKMFIKRFVWVCNNFKFGKSLPLILIYDILKDIRNYAPDNWSRFSIDTSLNAHVFWVSNSDYLFNEEFIDDFENSYKLNNIIDKMDFLSYLTGKDAMLMFKEDGD